eukprot:gnl/MRDRNA2_/MRDRNA2_87452_c0_seq1.p1 gnl/MRDRNA2_/MRDRNA2_87452_c0~~gnl/MRDRNA2_/MRDRNA2_87452_c0_seq1.p1  ORF type:complete len:299 (-),score=111.92 gnl/MRDRNA2_/MRDRNA2_87452_c0_seq1:116-907(-)
MVSIAALLLCALVPAAVADDMGTCDASDPSKCVSKAGTEEAEKGSALLQSTHLKARATDVQEDLYEEPRSQVEENFNEIQKHADALTSRLELLLENAKEDGEPLEQDVEERVHKAISLLHQSQKELKSVRGKHAALIQNPGNDHESNEALLQAMTHIQHYAREAEEVLSEVEDDEDGEEKASLLQEGEEEGDGEEEEDEEEEDDEEGHEDDEEEDDDEEHDEDEEDGDEKDIDENPEDMAEIQVGEGVQHPDAEEDQKTIERH